MLRRLRYFSLQSETGAEMGCLFAVEWSILVGMLTHLALVLGLSVTSSAPEERFEAGRSAFEQGLRALDAGQIEAAIVAFERSVEARESPPALYNLGLAYRREGRLVDALTAFERFLDLAAIKQGDASTTRHAQVLTEELRAALARLTVSIEGAAKTVAIDGHALDPSRDNFGLVLDPGPHTFTVVATDGRIVERRTELTRGARLNLVVDLAPPRPLVAATPTPAVEVGPSSWWWVGLGVGLAVVAGSAAVLVATHDNTLEPSGGTTGVVLRGLGGR